MCCCTDANTETSHRWADVTDESPTKAATLSHVCSSPDSPATKKAGLNEEHLGKIQSGAR